MSDDKAALMEQLAQLRAENEALKTAKAIEEHKIAKLMLNAIANDRYTNGEVLIAVTRMVITMMALSFKPKVRMQEFENFCNEVRRHLQLGIAAGL
jgi:hypothetical protein